MFLRALLAMADANTKSLSSLFSLRSISSLLPRHHSNEEELMHFLYMRFLENQIRQAFGFEGTPIHLIARKRK